MSTFVIPFFHEVIHQFSERCGQVWITCGWHLDRGAPNFLRAVSE
ncbi:MAG TPA: hypothetical protein VFB60_24530 [Ktedonobacteraceae bacterium]|nr:hypothetical protein [Ktedonobacteraceae bacterium]